MGAVGVAPSTTTIDLPDGSTIALADWIDDKFYSTVQLNNGQNTPVIAFMNTLSQPIAGGTRISTRVDTNIPRSGSNGLPKDWEMLVYGISVMIVRAMRPNTAGNITLADLAGANSDPPSLQTWFQLDRVIYCQYIYNFKQYSDGVMQHYPQGHGYSVFSTNTTFELSQNGIPSPRDRIAMVLPIHEREMLGYEMDFSPETSLVISQISSQIPSLGFLTSVDVRVDKVGLIKRPVV